MSSINLIRPILGRRSDLHGFIFLLSVAAFRFAYSYYESPYLNLWSDPKRHYDIALHFYEPTVMGAVDPFFYGFWLNILLHLDNLIPHSFDMINGLSSAIVPIGWLGVLLRFMPFRFATIGAVLISINPDTIGIFSFFMTESLVTLIIPFAIWSSLSASERKTIPSFATAVVLWGVIGFTRAQCWVIAAAFLIMMIYSFERRLLGAMIVALVLTPGFLYTGIRTQAALNYFNPFGHYQIIKAYQVSGMKVIRLELLNHSKPNGYLEFISPSYASPSFAPFSNWTTGRIGTRTVTIDLSRGRSDWDRAIDISARERSIPIYRDYIENFVYLNFSQMWPINQIHNPIGTISFWQRFFWLPVYLTAFAFLYGRVYLRSELILPICVLTTYVFFVVQNASQIEARYRLPLDPIAVASLYIGALRLRQKYVAPDPVVR